MGLPIGGEVVVKQACAKRVFNFYPKVFRDEVLGIKGSPEIGDIVKVRAESGLFLGIGFFNPLSRVTVRILTHRDEEIGKAFFKKKIKEAVAIRGESLPPAVRVFFAEADGIPGLIVDKYGEYIVVQLRNPGLARNRGLIVDALVEVFSPKGIYERSDSEPVDEGTEPFREPLFGEVPETVEFEHLGLRFLADIHYGPKTGFFLDQAETRRLATKVAQEGWRVLDLFCYCASFSALLAAFKKCKCTAVDKDRRALSLAKRIASMNGISLEEIAEADAFKFLRKAASGGQKFDMVVIDPPALVKRKQDISRGKAMFVELAENALQTLSEGGVLCLCSCAYFITLDMLVEAVRIAAGKLRRRFAAIGVTYQSPDHPWVPQIPETLYLKCLWIKILPS